MTDTSSPSILPPPPKRAPGVKRLNSVPKMIAFGVVIVFFLGVGYTAIQRAKSSAATTAAEADDKRVQGGKAPAFLTMQGHGEIQASLVRPLTRQPPDDPPAAPATPPATTTSAGTTTADQPQDVAEQARIRAWQAYYQRVDALVQKRFDANMQAMAGGNQQQLQQPPYVASEATPGGGDVAAAGAGGFSTGGTDPAGQTGKQAFLRQAGDVYGVNEDLPGSVHGPKPDTIMEGTPLPGRLVDAATSDSPGQLVAEITTNVCDSMTGNDLLIPQGTRIITTYDTAVSAGQSRIGTIAQRLIFPDTSSRQLGSVQIADQSGMAGLKDIVRTHFWEKFWATAIISLSGAGAQLAQPQQSAFSAYSPTSVATGQMTQGFSELGRAYAQQGLSIPNTIELRSGLPLVVKMNHDLHLPPYVDQRGYTRSGGTCS